MGWKAEADLGEPGLLPEVLMVSITVGGEMLRAGLGALELAMGLAKPDWNPDAAPLTLALALTSPDIPIPWRSNDITGGEPPEDEDPNEPIEVG